MTGLITTKAIVALHANGSDRDLALGVDEFREMMREIHDAIKDLNARVQGLEMDVGVEEMRIGDRLKELDKSHKRLQKQIRRYEQVKTQSRLKTYRKHD